MSGQSTPWFRQQMLLATFHRTTVPFTAFQVCLTQRVPAANAALNQLNEPPFDSNGYARSTVSLGAANWLLSGTDMLNAAPIFFTRPGGTGWGTCHGWALVAAGVNQVCAVGTLNEPYRILGGYKPVLEPGAISFGLHD